MVLCTGLLVGCDKEEEYEPVSPPVEEPDEPVIPPSTNSIINFKIGNINMIVGSNLWNAIAYGNSKYVVVGGDRQTDGFITTSTNGTAWSTPKNIGKEIYWLDIIFENGLFVTVGYRGMISSSSDGVTWKTPTQYGAQYNWTSVAYGNGRFVTVAENGWITYSKNGTGWQSPKSGIGGLAYSITYGNGKFVVVGYNGIVASNADTEYISSNSWEENKVGNSTWNSVVFGNGKFVAVGDGGYFTSSEDGIEWTSRKLIGTKNWKSIIWNNNKFVVVGDNGYIATSTDGITWTTPEQIKDESGKVVTATLNGVCAMP